MIKEEFKLSYKKLCSATILFVVNSLLFVYGIVTIYNQLFMVMSALLIFVLLYKKCFKDALLVFGINYVVHFVLIRMLSLIYNYVKVLELNISRDLSIVVFMFIPIWIIYFLVYINRRRIYAGISLVKELKAPPKIIIIICYIFIAVNSFEAYWIVSEMVFSLDSFFYGTSLMLVISSLLYIAGAREGARETELLNKELKGKIIELKKLKHDYGSEISGLYGLYQMKKYDNLGNMLKNIIKRYEAVDTSIELDLHSTPMVNLLLSPLKDRGIDVIIADNGDYEDLSLTEDELYKVISNIIKNSIEALKDCESPYIKYKSYNGNKSLIVEVENNGPQIEEGAMKKIFNLGYSTKENSSGDRGLGLSIVKELLDSVCGRISAESYQNRTVFKITVPRKLT